jgi:SPP1 family predicted phage head-tail adaptor
VTQDAELNNAETWADWKTVWAEPLDQTSREFYRLATANAEITRVWRIRYLTGVTPYQRIKYGSEYLEIVGKPINEGERNESLLVSCKAVM